MSCNKVNFNEKLIELVREAPSLYDKGCAHYKDKQRKENAWKLIADILGVSVEECKTRWKTLRNRYTKDKNIQVKSGAAGGESRKPWYLSHAMDFLGDHLHHKPTTSNFTVTSNKVLDLTLDHDSERNILLDLYSDEDETTELPLPEESATTSGSNAKVTPPKKSNYKERLCELMQENSANIANIIASSPEDDAAIYSRFVGNKAIRKGFGPIDYGRRWRQRKLIFV